MPENEIPAAESLPQEITIDGPRLTLILVAMIIPFYISGDRLFHIIWENRTPLINLTLAWWAKGVSILLAVMLHELIHGLIFALYAPHGFKSVTFGVNLKMGALYCHCRDPLKVKYYRRAGIAPMVVLGLIPLIFGLSTGVSWIKTFGLLLTIGGFGDLLICIKLLKFNRNLMILDHPEKLGFIIENSTHNPNCIS
jgi:hypothetical protein